MIRRDLGRSLVSVWSEEADLASLRGFERGVMEPGHTPNLDRICEELSASSGATTQQGLATAVVVCSNPSRIDARSVSYATSLAAVSGQDMCAIVPRGARNVASGHLYTRRVDARFTLEVTPGPSWLCLGSADVVLLDLEYEQSTRFGPVLIALANTMGLPIVNLPGSIPVGKRNARTIGQPLLEAIEHASETTRTGTST